MARTRRPLPSIFTLSFLDIISCAFGAVVLLVLLSKNAEQSQGSENSAQSISEIRQLLQKLTGAQSTVLSLEANRSEQEQLLADQIDATKLSVAEVNARVNSSENAESKLTNMTNELRQLETQLSLATAKLQTKDEDADPEKDVGGIPTDAEYVIFVIDNSGSMAQIGWRKVVKTVSDVIENHPKLKGFNVMAADGTYLPMQKGGWIEDNKLNRRLALAELMGFQGGSSAPERGIMKAIGRYKNTQGKVSVYVFGDEFALSNVRTTVEKITQANYDENTKKPRFRIHGIGFYWRNGNQTRVGFSAFMRSVAHHNRGAFIALDVR